MEIIRQRIREEILNSKYSQSELARLLGIKQQSVNDYCRMKTLPALDTLAKLCMLLDIDANYILGITDYNN